MAEEEKKEAAAPVAEGEGDAAPPSFFKKFKLFIFIGAGLIFIGGGAGLFFAMKSPPPEAHEEAAAEGGHGEKADAHGKKADAHGEKADAHGKKADAHGADDISDQLEKEPEGHKAAKPSVDEIALGDLEQTKFEGVDVESGDINEALMVKLDPLVVNIFEKNSIHYLKLQMEFAVSSAEAVEETRVNKAKLRDRALFIVSDTTLREVLSPGGKALLKEDIVSSFNKILKKGKVTQLYFTDFTIQ